MYKTSNCLRAAQTGNPATGTARMGAEEGIFMKDEQKKILEELVSNFADIKARKELMAQFGNSKMPFFGVNEDGEDVEVHIAESSIIVKTNQENGWTRVNYYGADGEAEGESFDGRWK